MIELTSVKFGPLKTRPVMIMQKLENILTLHGVILIENGC